MIASETPSHIPGPPNHCPGRTPGDHSNAASRPGEPHQPLQAHPGHKLTARWLPQQPPFLAGGIDHPVAVHINATAIGAAQGCAESILLLPADHGLMSEPDARAPSLRLRHQPLPQGGEIEHHALGPIAAPVATAPSWAQEFPATPPLGHHAARQTKRIESLQRKGSTAEGGATQVRQAFNQQHINRVGGQLAS